MVTQSLVCRHVVLALFVNLLVTGCASIPGAQSRTIVSESYDLPAALEANAVIRAVERAFARTLAMPPRIVEGSVPSPLPAVPAHFRVEDRQVYLDRLGVVSAHRVNCPESMAVVHAFVTGASHSSGLHSYTACIQLYAEGYRVSLVAGSMVLESHDDITEPMDSEPKSGPDILSHIAQGLREEISEARLVADSHEPESGSPVWRSYTMASADQERSTTERVASLASPPELSAANHSAYREDAVSTLPLVCLAPRGESALVRSARGEGYVVTVLDSGSIMTVAEPVDADYFLVETVDGMAGWINRSDVKRLPCPIG